MKRFAAALGAAVATGILLTLALPLGEQAWVMGFALVPLLVVTKGKGVLAGFLGGIFAVFVAAWVSTTGWLYRHPSPGDPIWVYGSFGKYGMSFAVAFAFWGERATRRWPTWCFAALGTLLEAVQLVQLPSHLALSQYRHAGMVQLASLGGIWLASFLLWWCNIALAEWWIEGRQVSRRFLWIPLAALLYVATARLWLPGPEGSRKVGAVQAGLDGDVLLRQYQQANKGGATLVVWPESAGILFTRGSDTGEMRLLSEKPGNAPFVTSFEDDHEPFPHNTAALFSGGRESSRYFKRRLFGDESRDHTPGDRAASAGDVGLNICFDSCFPSVLRDTARLGPSIIALPTIDPPSTNHFLAGVHASYTPFRAAENGVAVVRADGYAYSQMVDARGRIVAEALPGDRTLVASVGVGPRWTLAKALGDWMLWVCGALWILGIVKARKRATSEPDSQ